MLPTRPRELSQAVKALATRSPALNVSSGYRGKERVLRLELLKNSVGSDPARTDATDATDARSEYKTLPDAVNTDDTDARLQATDDGRGRFSL